MMTNIKHDPMQVCTDPECQCIPPERKAELNSVHVPKPMKKDKTAKDDGSVH